MRRVVREHCACPKTWTGSVQKALPDYALFLRLASEFERLGVNSAVRRAGFSSYAPQVLVTKAGKAGFPAVWGLQKELIAAMSHRKCVYCETPINAPRGAHVDHFKPKALFPSLAYEWTNYFLGCPGCNGAKGDKWPKHGGYIRPDRGDPSRHFVFAEDGTVRAAKAGSVAGRMLDDLDLKRKWLSDARKLRIAEMLRLLDDAARLYREGNEEQARRLATNILENVSRPERAFSTALTQCFWQAWESACPRARV